MSLTPPDNVHDVLSRYMLADGFDQIVDLEKSHGSWIYDPISEREYLDLFSCVASMPVGWNHPRVLSRRAELAVAAVHKPSNSDIYSTQMADFVETFARIAKPDHFSYLFFISGGGLAVENALKAAFDWKMRKRLVRGQSAEVNLQVVHFKQAFHGRTGYTLSITDSPDIRKTQYFPQFSWPRIPNPKITFPLGENLARVRSLEKQAINEIKAAIHDNPDRIAALIIEPIQGEGGDNHFRAEFMYALRTICDEAEIMFILDEIQTGVGLTGKFWAYEHFSVTPDMIAFGKKTQVCGFMCSERIDEVERNVFHESNRLNSTWGGNLVDMVRMIMYLEVIAEEGSVGKAAEQGEYLLQKILEVQAQYPRIVSNARGRGLMCAFDLSTPEERDRLLQLIRKHGALMLGCGTRTIRFRPHLNIGREEIDTGMRIIDRALSEL